MKKLPQYNIGEALELYEILALKVIMLSSSW